MDRYEKRRHALSKLVAQFGRGGIATVAASIGKDPSYVSRMLYEPGKNGQKRIGEDSWESLITAYPQISDNSTDSQDIDGGRYIRVQHLDVEAGMGSERVNADCPEVIGEMTLSVQYLRSVLGFLPKANRLVLMTGRGDSMVPTIAPGEVLLVDTGVTCFEYDAIYAINLGNGLQVKRLIDVGDAIQVRSDNSLYPAFDLPDSAVIVGKVILRNRLDRMG